MKKAQLAEYIASPLFRKVFGVLGILFIILTYFISINPGSFLGFGYFGIFVFNVVSSGLLLLPLVVGKFNIIGIVVVSSLGNIINTSINYVVGHSSSRMFSHLPFINSLKKFVKRFGLVAVYVLSIVPFPIDINGLLSGYLEIPFRHYILANFLGKLTVFLLAGLGLLSFTSFFQK